MLRTHATCGHPSDNYYILGTARVRAKLNTMGIEVPSTATEFLQSQVRFISQVELTRIERAMFDWFRVRDHEQARALIRAQPVQHSAHVIRILHLDTCPSGLTQDMICPSLCDAMAAVIYGCDQDTVALDDVRCDNDTVIAVIQGVETLRIEPIVCEPFDISIRDRVRVAFKGVRKSDTPAILDRAARLPGLANVAISGRFNRHKQGVPNGCLLFGFPTNWAFAMRGALQQVNITVTQSQAQELVAVFFGANSWHQLIKHRDQLNSTVLPVAVNIVKPVNRQLFFHTPEEALFAVATAAKAITEPLMLTELDLSLDNQRLRVEIMTIRYDDKNAPGRRLPGDEAINAGSNDYWAAVDYAEPGHIDAALELCEKLAINRNGSPTSAVTTTGILYKGDGLEALLIGLLTREGLPSENLIFIGEFAFAVFHVPDPDDRGMLTAHLRIYRLDESGIKLVRYFAMYKVHLEVKIEGGEKKLVFRPDVGHAEPIEVDFDDNDQVKRLIALTHGDNLYVASVPQLPAVADPYLP